MLHSSLLFNIFYHFIFPFILFIYRTCHHGNLEQTALLRERERKKEGERVNIEESQLGILKGALGNCGLEGKGMPRAIEV